MGSDTSLMARRIPSEYQHIDDDFWRGPAQSSTLSSATEVLVWVKADRAATFLRSYGEDELGDQAALLERPSLSALGDLAAGYMRTARAEGIDMRIDEAVARAGSSYWKAGHVRCVANVEGSKASTQIGNSRLGRRASLLRMESDSCGKRPIDA